MAGLSNGGVLRSQLYSYDHRLFERTTSAVPSTARVELKIISAAEKQAAPHCCSRRRSLLLSSAALPFLLLSSENAIAVKQVLLAGRVPGLSAPDENGNLWSTSSNILDLDQAV
ncbi:hypothetical protein L7F22_025687 [Adiantum nelumboides]|nr:hypothetical protein [Adiantum nelumboides]